MRTKKYKSFLICALVVLDVIEREFKISQQYISLLLLIIKLSRYFVVRAILHDIVVNLFALTFFSFANNSNASNVLNDLRFLFVFNCKRSFALSCLKSMSQRFLMRETHSSIEWMLDLRSYEIKIVFNITQDDRMKWNDNLVLYREIQFIMIEFRTWIHDLLHEIQTLCVNELLLQRTTRAFILSVDWNNLRDDFNNSNVN